MTGKELFDALEFGNVQAGNILFARAAIALTLQSLRAIARYGVTTEKGEQYTGWLQLPASPETDELTALALEIIAIGNLSIEPD